jgi:hypothetical protein
MGFVVRWIFAFLLVAVTYNPSSYNYVAWASANSSTQLPLVILLGLLLLVGYIIFLNATLRSIGIFGMALVLAILAALIWVLYGWGWLSLENPGLNTWLGIVAVSVVLAVGMTWSIIWRRASGQVDVDETEP